MRILVLAPNYGTRVNWGRQLWRNEIARQHSAIFHGNGHKLSGHTDVRELVKEYGPFDVVTVGENPRHFEHYEHLDKCSAVKVCFVCDYWGGKKVNYNRLIRKHQIDVVIMPNKWTADEMEEMKCTGYFDKDIQINILPYVYAVDTRIYYDREPDRKYDVMCIYGLFEPIYPKRPELQRLVNEMDRRTLIGNWKTGIKNYKYVTALQQSKIFVSVNGIYKSLTMKYFEAMACGTLFLTDRPKDLEYFGIKNGVHLVCYTDFDDMEKKVEYYLTHEDERLEIVQAGKRFAEDKFNMKGMVGQWTNIVEKYFQQ